MEETERPLALEAIAVAEQDPRAHKVGAVLVKDGAILKGAAGGTISKRDHAECTLLERLLGDQDLRGLTLFVTLEPCMRSRHWAANGKYLTCAEIIEDRGIARVVIGMKDPDRRIHARGAAFLQQSGVLVDWFSADLQSRCADLNQRWIEEKLREWRYPELFPWLAANADEAIQAYMAFKVDGTLTLQLAPTIETGWPSTAVQLLLDPTFSWTLPKELAEQYHNSLGAPLSQRATDSCFMLIENPKSFSDEPTITLKLGSTRYSYVQLYKQLFTRNPEKRGHLIHEVFSADHQIAFPNTLSLHLIVVTVDGYILLTRRSSKVDYYPRTWSFSIEEQIKAEDISAPKGMQMIVWVERAIVEELGLSREEVRTDSLRVLSVVLESEIMNTAVCALVELRLTRDELDDQILTMPRSDYEFDDRAFLEYSVNTLLPEIIWPRQPYHPTSRYRMVTALLAKFGLPNREG